MSERNKCKWCGASARQEQDHQGEYVIAACGTTYFGTQRSLMRSARCELRETQKRIDDAIIKADRAIRFGLTPKSTIVCVLASDLADVVEILRGNSPTNLEGK